MERNERHEISVVTFANASIKPRAVKFISVDTFLAHVAVITILLVNDLTIEADTGCVDVFK